MHDPSSEERVIAAVVDAGGAADFAATPEIARAVSRRPRALDIAAVVMTIVAFAAPAVGALLRPGAAEASVHAEARTPAVLPGLPHSPREAARLPRELKTWHDDHLGLRDVALRVRSRLLLDGLGISPTPSALIGDDGWLWYAGEGSVAAWRGTTPLRPEHVVDWVRVFRDRAAWCEAQGIVYVATIVPNKFEIYPERVPAGHTKVGPSRYDQMNEALCAEPGGWYLDMRAVLRDERLRDGESDFTYSRRGTHWTGRAALRAAVELMTRAKAAGIEVEIPSSSSFGFQPMGFDDDAWSGQLHMPDLEKEIQPVLVRNLSRRWRPTQLLDGVPKRVETLTGVESMPRLWLVHDSFGVLLRMLFSPFFARTTCDWNGLGELDPQAMLEFGTDVVFDVHTERQTFRSPPSLTASRDPAERDARFERATPVWTLAASADRVVTEPGLACTVEGGELVLVPSHAGAGVVLADADTGVPGTAMLRLALDVEHASSIVVQWQSRGLVGWSAMPGDRFEVEPGLQVLTMEFVDATARGPIRITPGLTAGTMRVRSAELRSAGW